MNGRISCIGVKIPTLVFMGGSDEEGKRKMKILTTSNYQMFKRVKGNRDINVPANQKHLDGIVNSMKAHGWIGAPIVVNKDMELIDGQNRLKAAEIAKVPVRYMVENKPIEPIEAVQIIGNTVKQWTIQDNIHRFADTGNENYIKLEKLMVKHKASSELVLRAMNIQRNNVAEKIKNGELVITDDRFEKADRTLSRLKELRDALDGYAVIGGAGGCKNVALLFIAENYSDKVISGLCDAIRKAPSKRINAADTETLISCFEEIYNRRKRESQRVDFEFDYKHSARAKSTQTRREKYNGAYMNA